MGSYNKIGKELEKSVDKIVLANLELPTDQTDDNKKNAIKSSVTNFISKWGDQIHQNEGLYNALEDIVAHVKAVVDLQPPPEATRGGRRRRRKSRRRKTKKGGRKRKTRRSRRTKRGGVKSRRRRRTKRRR